jgi:hypothetical protein
MFLAVFMNDFSYSVKFAVLETTKATVPTNIAPETHLLTMQTSTQRVLYGTSPGVPQNDPTIEGYEFVGWVPSYQIDESFGAEVFWHEIHPINPDIPLESVLTSAYINDKYQVIQDVIFIAVFRDLVKDEIVPPWDNYSTQPLRIVAVDLITGDDTPVRPNPV